MGYDGPTRSRGRRELHASKDVEGRPAVSPGRCAPHTPPPKPPPSPRTVSQSLPSHPCAHATQATRAHHPPMPRPVGASSIGGVEREPSGPRRRTNAPRVEATSLVLVVIVPWFAWRALYVVAVGSGHLNTRTCVRCPRARHWPGHGGGHLEPAAPLSPSACRSSRPWRP